MRRKSTLCYLSLLAATVLLPQNLYAQFRLFPFAPRNNGNQNGTVIPQPGTPPVTTQPSPTPIRQSTPNPEHEKMKQEAQNLYEQGEHSKVVEMMTKVLNGNPQDDIALYMRGSSLVEIGVVRSDTKLIRRGIDDSRAAVRIDQKEHAIYYLPYLYGMTNLAKLENHPKHAQVALQIADQALRLPDLLNNDKAHIYYQRANTYSVLKQYDNAIKDYQQAIEFSSTHLGAYSGLADAAAAAGKTKEALNYYNNAIKKFPSNALLYNNRGMFHQAQGQYSLAVVDFTKALELNPKFYQAHTNRGFVLMKQGEFLSAENEFSKSLEINPAQHGLIQLRAASKLSRGDTQGAIKDYREILRTNGNDEVAHAELGFALFFANQTQEALNEFESALRIKRNMAYLAPWRTITLQLLNRHGEAKRYASAVYSQLRRDKSWTGTLMGFLSGDISEDAMMKAANSGDATTKASQLCEAHFFAGYQNQIQGKKPEAMEQFKAAINTKANHLSAWRGSRYEIRKHEYAGVPKPIN